MAPLPKPIGFSSSVKKRKDQVKCYQFLCVGLCLLPLPITQIVYSSINEPLVCPGNLFPFTINTWLYIEAATTMAVFLNFVLIQMAAIHISPTAYTTRGLIAIQVLWLIFQTSWIIVGSIQFWRDCYTLEPVSVNILMWVTLILGIIRSVGNNNQKILLIED
jgi:hypothetical protein